MIVDHIVFAWGAGPERAGRILESAAPQQVMIEFSNIIIRVSIS